MEIEILKNLRRNERRGKVRGVFERFSETYCKKSVILQVFGIEDFRQDIIGLGKLMLAASWAKEVC